MNKYGPEDIDDATWKDALSRTSDIESREWDDKTFLTVAETIARAILSERTKAAEIAEEVGDAMWPEAPSYAIERISQAIRKGGKE